MLLADLSWLPRRISKKQRPIEAETNRTGKAETNRTNRTGRIEWNAAKSTIGNDFGISTVGQVVLQKRRQVIASYRLDFLAICGVVARGSTLAAKKRSREIRCLSSASS